MEQNTPTAQELIEQTREKFNVNVYRNDGGLSDAMEQSAMVRFAKLHVEAALKEAAEKALLSHKHIKDIGGKSVYLRTVDKDSILTAYDLNNIK